MLARKGIYAPGRAVGAPHESQLLHLALQLHLPGPTTHQQVEPLLQAFLVVGRELALAFRSLTTDLFRCQLSLESLD